MNEERSAEFYAAFVMEIINGKTIGFALTGSFCTLSQVLPQVKRLVHAGATVIPVLSEIVNETDTRFGTANEWRDQLTTITGNAPLVGVKATEPFGPKGLLDLLVVAPCTGNTLGKLANGITDTGVTMAVKAHLRNERPVVLAVSTNDGLGGAAKNIGTLLDIKHTYFVPFGQDDPEKKPRSLVAQMDLILETAALALNGIQIQPVFKK